MTTFADVKQAVDIVAYIESRVALKKQGRLYVACCPFHAEKTPSFKVDPEKQRWDCYGACGAGGDVFEFVQQYDRVDKGEALRIVADYAHITLDPVQSDKHKRLYEALSAAAALAEKTLYTPFGSNARRYLRDSRNLTDEVIKAARIGLTPPGGLLPKGFTDNELLEAGLLAKGDDGSLYAHFRNRIMIPVFDDRGRVIGFNGRAMGDFKPKYLNSPETELFKKSKILYTLRQKNAQGKAQEWQKVKVIVEGPFDAISGLMRGFKGIHAQMGAALSIDQLSQLAKGDTETIVFCFDNDDAGEKMMRRLAKEHVHTAARLGVDLLIMRPPQGKDADDTFREKPELWQDAVNAARPVVDVLIDLELESLPSNASAVQKNKAAIELMKVLKHDNALIEKENLGKLAARLGLTDQEMERIARPQLVMLHTPPAPKIESTPLPSNEEWVLHGILLNEDDHWLDRANARLLTTSDDPMPYALASLSAQDFTDPHLRRLFDMVMKARQEGEAFGAYIDRHIDRSLEAVYKRLIDLEEIGQAFGVTFTFDVFVSSVYQVRIARLRNERPQDPAKARECAMGCAGLILAWEDLLEV